MVALLEADLRTREVLRWTGIHLFHFSMSSCSQKLRIYLALKGVAWTSHPVDLSAHENWSEWYLGINPRGLVPALVLDGAVHVESNDIIALVEARHPSPALIPPGRAAEVAERLRREDALHLDLRTLSFRFVYGRAGTTKSPQALAAFRAGGSGTVGGRADPDKEREAAFYERLARDGLTDAACGGAAARFRAVFAEFEASLATSPYLLGAELSVVDIAWFVYACRLELAGYPFARLHPRLWEWFARLAARPPFAREVEPPPASRDAIAGARREQERAGTTMCAVLGW